MMSRTCYCGAPAVGTIVDFYHDGSVFDCTPACAACGERATLRGGVCSTRSYEPRPDPWFDARVVMSDPRAYARWQYEQEYSSEEDAGSVASLAAQPVWALVQRYLAGDDAEKDRVTDAVLTRSAEDQAAFWNLV